MKLNQAGIDLIKRYESCRLAAYPDPASPLGQQILLPLNARKPGWQSLSGAPWTIGWGTTGVDTYTTPPSPIGPTTVWTQEQADARFKKDLELFSNGVKLLLKVDVSENQFSALVSFAYNCGLGSLKGSTLLQLVNRGKYTQAADEFLKWNKAKGKVLRGLVERRETERRLFLTP